MNKAAAGFMTDRGHPLNTHTSHYKL